MYIHTYGSTVNDREQDVCTVLRTVRSTPYFLQYIHNVRSYCRHTVTRHSFNSPRGDGGTDRGEGGFRRGKKERWPTELNERMEQGERNDEALRAGLATPQTVVDDFGDRRPFHS